MENATGLESFSRSRLLSTEKIISFPQKWKQTFHVDILRRNDQCVVLFPNAWIGIRVFVHASNNQFMYIHNRQSPNTKIQTAEISSPCAEPLADRLPETLSESSNSTMLYGEQSSRPTLLQSQPQNPFSISLTACHQSPKAQETWVIAV